MMEEEEYYQVELPIEAVRIIHKGLSQAYEKWSGGDAQEQVNLGHLKSNLFRIMLERQFPEKP